MNTVRLRLVFFLGLLLAALAAWLFLDGRVGPGAWGRGYLINRNWAQATVGLGKPVAALWLLGLWAWVARRNRAALAALAALLLSGLLVTPPKELFRRIRPSSTHLSQAELAEPEHYHRSRSFPSGDTAQAFAMAVALGPELAAPWRLGLFGLAGVVGFKRFLDNAHYPSDVLAGAALGLLAGWIALALDRRLLGRAPPRTWRRRPWHFWLLTGTALAEPIAAPYLFTHALVAWGPFLAVGLLAARGRQWLRWAAGPARPGQALLGLLGLAALGLVPSLGWSGAWTMEQGGFLKTVEALSADPCAASALGGWSGAPMAPWLAGLLGWALQDPLLGARLLSSLAALGALACLFRLGCGLAGPKAGVLAGTMCAASLSGGLLGRLAWPGALLGAAVLLAGLGGLRLLATAGRSGRRLWVLGAALSGLTAGLPGVLLCLFGPLLSALLPGNPAPPWKLLLGRLLPAALVPSLAWLGLAATCLGELPLCSWLHPPDPGTGGLHPLLAPALVLAGLGPWLLGLGAPPAPAGLLAGLPGRAFLAGQLLPLFLVSPLAPVPWQAGLWAGPVLLAAAARRASGPAWSPSRAPAAWAAGCLLATLLLWRCA